MTKKENKYDLNKNSSIIISSVDSVTPLDIEIDNKLNFEKHFSTTMSLYDFIKAICISYRTVPSTI